MSEADASSSVVGTVSEAQTDQAPTGRRLRMAFVDHLVEPDKPGTTGLSTVNWSMAREFARLGDEVHIVAPYSVDPEPFPGITVHRFPLPPLGYRNIVGHVLIALRARWELTKIRGLDFVHAPEYLSTGVIAPLTRLPVVLSTPGNVYERIAAGVNPWGPVTTAVFKAAARSSARRSRLVVAISTDMARWWGKTGASPDRIVVIPRGVDTSLFRRIPDARNALGLAPEQAHAVYVGRFSTSKNVRMLLRAAARLRENPARRDMVVHLIGSGPLERELKALTTELGLGDHVVFHGQVPFADVPGWYSAADAVVLPSTSEPLGRVMLEAMACGAPFVATRVSGPLDHIRDGENGLLVAVGDDAALADRLRRLVDDPAAARALGDRAMAYVQGELTWAMVVRRFRAAVAARLGPGAGTAIGRGSEATRP